MLAEWWAETPWAPAEGAGGFGRVCYCSPKRNPWVIIAGIHLARPQLELYCVIFNLFFIFIIDPQLHPKLKTNIIRNDVKLYLLTFSSKSAKIDIQYQPEIN